MADADRRPTLALNVTPTVPAADCLTCVPAWWASRRVALKASPGVGDFPRGEVCRPGAEVLGDTDVLPLVNEPGLCWLWPAGGGGAARRTGEVFLSAECRILRRSPGELVPDLLAITAGVPTLDEPLLLCSLADNY